MKHEIDIEQFLSNATGPRIPVGAHREHLKRRLLQSMRTEHPIRMTWKMGLATCCLAVLLATSGWAAHAVYLNFFVVDTEMEVDVVNRDGSVSTAKSMVAVSSDSCEFTRESASAQWLQVKRAIEAGNYMLLDVVATDSEQPVYIYGVTLENGSTASFGTTKALPAVEGERPRPTRE